MVDTGGLINVADELEPGGYVASRARARTAAIAERLRSMFAESERTGDPPGRVALRTARERVERRR